eukprot:CAMPEP_0178962358 /NCGR_PEP_ID=MMETSP0789-20121207/14311_1 /TAXON_ID=3005 /ORGANISM="Rhizosolenia setigera, Strain CCMP 1694" /LENGTH=183 /DNA_ID=CAMNT_0020646481 /DNA_START=193 /DNA_END=744 /DNA_ORIENTATION=+
MDMLGIEYPSNDGEEDTKKYTKRSINVDNNNNKSFRRDKRMKSSKSLLSSSSCCNDNDNDNKSLFTDPPKYIPSKQEFDTLLLSTDMVLCKFTADWCRPCKKIDPFFSNQLNQRFSNVLFVKVDVDQLDDVTAQYDVKIMPTFVLFHDGSNNNNEKKEKREYKSYSGSDPNKLEEFLEQHVSI